MDAIRWLVSGFVVAAFWTWGTPCTADVITLKSGEQLQGRIIAEVDDCAMVRLDSGETRWITKSEIRSVVEAPPARPPEKGEKDQRPCPGCGGKGKVECLSCPACGACTHGIALCLSCPPDAPSECRACSGTGRARCDACDGTGKGECADCDKGIRLCTTCKGTGSISDSPLREIRYPVPYRRVVYVPELDEVKVGKWAERPASECPLLTGTWSEITARGRIELVRVWHEKSRRAEVLQRYSGAIVLLEFDVKAVTVTADGRSVEFAGGVIGDFVVTWPKDAVAPKPGTRVLRPCVTDASQAAEREDAPDSQYGWISLTPLGVPKRR